MCTLVVGFLLQWPTLPTLIMFPVLAWVYRRLATADERETRERFGTVWDAYAARTPRVLANGPEGDAEPARRQ